MPKYPYKVIENHWHVIFIIRAGVRRFELGEFESLKIAQDKCDELNKSIK